MYIYIRTRPSLFLCVARFEIFYDKKIPERENFSWRKQDRARKFYKYSTKLQSGLGIILSCVCIMQLLYVGMSSLIVIVITFF